MGLIDDVMKNINSGINEIQNKSQEVMQQLTITNRIKSLEERKNALLINIGQLIFDKYEKGDEVSEDLLKEKTKELSQIEKDIESARAELKQYRPADPNAPHTEKAAHGAGYKPTPGFQCPHCGAPANSTKFYCVSCGGSLKEAANAAGGNGQSGQQNFTPGNGGETKSE
jgi:hypothetical protein